MTAAHCAINEHPKAIRVALGHSDIEKAINVPVRSILIHPDYEIDFASTEDEQHGRTMDNDIALLILNVKLTFSNTIQKLSLPPANYAHYNLFSSELYFGGYGAEEDEVDSKAVETGMILLIRHEKKIMCFFIDLLFTEIREFATIVL